MSEALILKDWLPREQWFSTLLGSNFSRVEMMMLYRMIKEMGIYPYTSDSFELILDISDYCFEYFTSLMRTGRKSLEDQILDFKDGCPRVEMVLSELLIMTIDYECVQKINNIQFESGADKRIKEWIQSVNPINDKLVKI
jgi:hypothetical protein